MHSTDHQTRIQKSSSTLKVSPHLDDYQHVRETFLWTEAQQQLAGLPDGKGLNIAHEAVDRHANGSGREQIAIRWLGKDGTRLNITYAELQKRTNRFANVLETSGLQAGDRVFVMAGRIPQLYDAVLGSLKHRNPVCPLFSAFGPEPIKARLTIGGATALVTTASLYRKKIAAIHAEVPTLRHVFIIADEEMPQGEGLHDLDRLMDEADEHFTIAPTDPEEMALLHFTSGTTGKPKGAVHAHQAVLAHHITGQMVLDFHPDDVYWCTADPGWVTGMSYGIISPLTNGVGMVVDEAEFDVRRWYDILAETRVSVWYTAPTAIRMMMKAGEALAQQRDFPDLRLIASVGEPLNPEAVRWGERAFGLPIHDNWWQTETGGIMLANYLAMDIKPGSMGRPLPGIDADIVRKEENGSLTLLGDNEEGELALRTPWPSMFRGYLQEEERYRKCFVEDYYLSGDLALRDEDGYFWFVGRADDVIKSSGHLIGPFEVESALMEHPAVAESGVIGKPDPIAGEIVKAFVALKQGYEPTDALRRELLGFARKRLGPAVAPREIDLVETLPRTRSGKIMRRLLKARELGLPEGDTSTLEGGQ